MFKSIDPKWCAYLGLLILLEQTVGHGGAAMLTNVVPTSWIDHITATCNALAILGTVIMTYQAGVSSPLAGPWINAPITPVAKVAILFAALLGTLVFAGPARADVNPLLKVQTDMKFAAVNLSAVRPAPAVHAPAPVTPKAALPDIVTSLDGLIDKLDKVNSDVVAKVVIDINAADTDAATLTNTADPASFKDPISHACYPAGVKFLQSLPVATPLTGEFQGVQLFQKKRDFIAMIQAGLPAYLKIGCGALLGDETKIFVALLGTVGITVATGGAGLLPGLALPALPALALPAL